MELMPLLTHYLIIIGFNWLFLQIDTTEIEIIKEMWWLPEVKLWSYRVPKSELSWQGLKIVEAMINIPSSSGLNRLYFNQIVSGSNCVIYHEFRIYLINMSKQNSTCGIHLYKYYIQNWTKSKYLL